MADDVVPDRPRDAVFASIQLQGQEHVGGPYRCGCELRKRWHFCSYHQGWRDGYDEGWHVGYGDATDVGVGDATGDAESSKS